MVKSWMGQQSGLKANFLSKFKFVVEKHSVVSFICWGITEIFQIHQTTLQKEHLLSNLLNSNLLTPLKRWNSCRFCCLCNLLERRQGLNLWGRGSAKIRTFCLIMNQRELLWTTAGFGRKRANKIFLAICGFVTEKLNGSCSNWSRQKWPDCLLNCLLNCLKTTSLILSASFRILVEYFGLFYRQCVPFIPLKTAVWWLFHFEDA